MIPRFRLYIDEVGNSDLGASENPNHRYLSLTGVIVSLQYVSDRVFPEMERLKNKYFGSHPDNPIVFHRKELVNKKHPFEALRTGEIEQGFNTELLQLIRDWDFT